MDFLIADTFTDSLARLPVMVRVATISDVAAHPFLHEPKFRTMSNNLGGILTMFFNRRRSFCIHVDALWLRKHLIIR